MIERVGIVHPGAMGVFVAVSIAHSGYEVCWASEGRSSDTVKWATQFQLRDKGTLIDLCQHCEVLVSVCPPHAALEMAKQVAECEYQGIYLDVNAISPQKVQTIRELMQVAGISFVDGGIIGRPDWKKGSTRLYLSGERAKKLQQLFAGGILQTAVFDGVAGQASALKMCYAAYTKKTTALLASILALAENHQVRHELAARWEEDWPGLYAASQDRIRKSTPKAWRFEGEMGEISQTFAAAGLPDDFHIAASKIFARQEEYKNVSEYPDFESIIKKILGSN